MLTVCKNKFCAEAAEEWKRGLDKREARISSLQRERKKLAAEACEYASALIEMFEFIKNPKFTFEKAQQLRSEIEPQIQKRIQKYTAMKADIFNT